MIDRGALSHAVNADVPVDPAAPRLPERAEQVIAASGGDVALARTLVRGAGPVADEAWRVAVALAGWRAGSVALRRAAVAGALDALAADPSLAAPFGRILLLDDADPASALRAVAADPFAWPTQLRGATIAEVGGFLGLDGPFLAPPTAVHGSDRVDRFVVESATGWFVLAADVCGHRFARLDDPTATGIRPEHVETTGSYLLRIRSSR